MSGNHLVAYFVRSKYTQATVDFSKAEFRFSISCGAITNLSGSCKTAVMPSLWKRPSQLANTN